LFVVGTPPTADLSPASRLLPIEEKTTGIVSWR
jgi:hypothetical protein